MKTKKECECSSCNGGIVNDDRDNAYQQGRKEALNKIAKELDKLINNVQNSIKDWNAFEVEELIINLKDKIKEMMEK